jgi:hypothetical protein
MNAKRQNGFEKGTGLGTERGTYRCEDCGKRTRETGSCESGVGLCLSCYDRGGLENEHNDGYHDTPDENCPKCQAVQRERDAVPSDVTLTLTARERRILELITALDIDVPRVVVNRSRMFADERGATFGATRAAQKDEVADLLAKIRNKVLAS